MSGRSRQRRSISEISHLFLSAVRERQRGGAAAPQRTPPPSSQEEMTPQELRQITGGEQAAGEPAGDAPAVRAVVAWHLGDRLLDAAKRYARNLAATGIRVGMVLLDAGELRLFTFDTEQEAVGEDHAPPLPCLDARAIRDAIGELRCDVDCWLLVTASGRLPEARALLRRVRHWVVLTTCDSAGLINCYRVLKAAARHPLPRVSVAALDAADPAEAETVFRRLAGACLQFLNWPVEAEPPLGDAFHVTECLALHCRADRDGIQTGLVAHFEVVAQCLKLPYADSDESPQQHEEAPATDAAQDGATHLQDAQLPQPAATHDPQTQVIAMNTDDPAEVIDLPEGGGEHSVIEAVLNHGLAGMVRCPVQPPDCPACCLAVGRDRRIALVAVSGRDMANLAQIARAWNWTEQNRQLLAMAMPQLAMDCSRPPVLHLLVEDSHAQVPAAAALFRGENIIVKGYRRVRWGGRAGLLLDAA